MKRKGFNLIEMLIVGAIIGLVFLLTAPLVKSFGMVNERTRVQNEVDREFAVVSKFIKKQVRSGRRTTELIDEDSDGDNDIDVAYVAAFDFDKDNTDKKIEKFTDLSLETKLKSSGDIEEGSGPVLFLEIPYEESDGSFDSKFVFFIYDEDNKQLKYIEEFDEDTEEVLVENVSGASFEVSSEGVVTFSIDLDVGEFEGKIKDSIRESAVSRIDLNI
jgi:prepilin-type N-terminal cleavage/methylation domain-containing protein